jgi:hypothetical protein
MSTGDSRIDSDQASLKVQCLPYAISQHLFDFARWTRREQLRDQLDHLRNQFAVLHDR